MSNQQMSNQKIDLKRLNTHNLKNIESGLRELCHHSDCTSIFDCPEEHKKCAPLLDLHTALAWFLAEKAHSLIEAVTCYSENRPMSSKLQIFGLYLMKSFFIVFDSHKDKYPQLYNYYDLLLLELERCALEE